MLKNSITTLAIVSLFLVQPAWSASRYVEAGHGDDSGPNDCSNKNNPCATITQAVNVSGNNDKIIVGPGIYTPGFSDFDLLPGVKVTSVAGAAGTIIDATGVGALGIFSIVDSDKAAVGAKGKGFTILVSNTASAAIRVSNSDSVKIEGNRIVSITNTVTNGINFESGSKATIRYNTVYSGGAGLFTNGINSTADEANTKWNVSDNKVVNAVNCLVIQSAAVNNGNKTTKNLLTGCQVRGLQIVNVDDVGNPSVSSKDKHTGNLIRMEPPSGGFQQGVDVDGGSPSLSKNLVDATSGSSDGIVLTDTTKASVKDNVMLGSGVGLLYGVFGSGPSSELVLSGNTVSNFSRGIQSLDIDEIKTLSKNNITSINGCAFNTNDVALPKPFKASKNFWGDPAGPNLLNCIGTTDDAVTNGNLTFSPASKANPIKFKDTFN